MTIQALKLVTGEELVASITAQHSGKTFVKDPLVLVVGRDQKGNIVVNFMPWTIIALGDIPIEDSAIMARYEVTADLEASYITNTTGIQIVPAGAAPQILQG